LESNRKNQALLGIRKEIPVRGHAGFAPPPQRGAQHTWNTFSLP